MLTTYAVEENSIQESTKSHKLWQCKDDQSDDCTIIGKNKKNKVIKEHKKGQTL